VLGLLHLHLVRDDIVAVAGAAHRDLVADLQIAEAKHPIAMTDHCIGPDDEIGAADVERPRGFRVKQFADFLDAAGDVVRYFKNERFGLSVTYYENNRPRQYYPDFIVAVREADGREVMWLAETKGEIRTNTALKRQAAESWCEKMSATTYGSWRHLFVPQRKFESAVASAVKTFAKLAEALV